MCAALGLTPVPATQVIARDRHAELLYACAALGHLDRAVRARGAPCWRAPRSARPQEPFAPGQKGSSAMPHKRNPVLSERLCGLARVLRGYLVAGLEDVALWHERDISHSSVERVVLPDALMLTVYMARAATGLAEGLVVHPERAMENLMVDLARAGLLPVGPARPRRRGHVARRRLPRRPGGAAARRRAAAQLPRGRRGGRRRCAARTRRARASLRPRSPPGAPGPLPRGPDVEPRERAAPPLLGQGARPLRGRRRAAA